MLKPMLLDKFSADTVLSWKSSFFVSEKFDGWRMLWNGNTQQFTTRAGNILSLPSSFYTEAKKFGKVILDGELWAGYQNFNEISAMDKNQLEFKVFDLVMEDTPFTQRLKILKILFKKTPLSKDSPLSLVDHFEFEERDLEEIRSILLDAVVKKGGEGIVLRRGNGYYTPNERSSDILKIKPVDTMELVVAGYTISPLAREKGYSAPLYPRNSNSVGSLGKKISYASSLLCLTEEKRQVSITFKAHDPPPVGSIIAVRYSDITAGGLPKFPVFLHVVPSDALDNDVVKTFKKLTSSSKPVEQVLKKKSAYTPLSPEKIAYLQKSPFYTGLFTAGKQKTFILKKGHFLLFKSERGQVYQVSCAKNGSSFYCSCPNWLFQRIPPIKRTCKHCQMCQVKNEA